MKIPLSPQMFPNLIWQFSKMPGEILCEELVLASAGKISGYNNSNEGGWEFLDGKIYFNGIHNPSAVLERVDAEVDEHFIFQGLSRVDLNTTLVLKAKKPRIGVFLKTHFWADTVRRAFDNLSNSWSGDVSILCDATNGTCIPDEYNTIYFTLSDFERMGLPIFPNRKMAAWYNSDYPNYHLLYKTDYDYFLVVEYDLFTGMNLAKLCESFIKEGLDYVGPWVSWIDHDGSWIWSGVQKKFDDARYLATGTARHAQHNYKSFFPFCFVSRSAALSCLAGRIDDSRLFRQINAVDWPFCESFFPTHLHANGFSIETLGRFGNISDLVFDVPKSWDEVEKQALDFAHPVFSGLQLVDKIFAYAPAAARIAGLKQVEWLKRQRGRLTTADEIRHFESKMTLLK